MSDKRNNDVEVIYTGRSLYHLTDNDGTYDAKLESKRDGTTHLYTTKSNWDDHSHDAEDSKGNLIYSRGEGSRHKWTDRFDD